MLLLQQLSETLALLSSATLHLELASSDSAITYVQAELSMSVPAFMFWEQNLSVIPLQLSNQSLLPSAPVSEADQKM